MHFLVLLYDDESAGNEPGTPEFDAEMAGYEAFGELAGDAIVAGEALEPSATARTVRHDGATAHITAGPFAEVAEVLGGLYVLEAPTLDDAIELVRHIPAVWQPNGAAEVRPMVQWLDDRPADGGDRSVQVLATIHGQETDSEQPGSDGWAAGAAEHGRFAEAADSVVAAAGAVHPSTTATTVRLRDGELLVSDGPFSEVNEVVGGLYLLAGPVDEVEEVAKQIPVPDGGAVELRPIMDLDG